MARTKFASLHSGLLMRKGEAVPTPPPALNTGDSTAEEVERKFYDGDVAEDSKLSPTLDRMVNEEQGDDQGDASAQASGAPEGEETTTKIDLSPEPDLPVEMEPQAEIRSVADILALGRTRGAMPIPQAASGHACGGAIVTLHLTSPQMERLDSIADGQGKPAAQLVMTAVTDYIRKVVAEN